MLSTGRIPSLSIASRPLGRRDDIIIIIKCFNFANDHRMLPSPITSPACVITTRRMLRESHKFTVAPTSIAARRRASMASSGYSRRAMKLAAMLSLLAKNQRTSLADRRENYDAEHETHYRAIVQAFLRFSPRNMFLIALRFLYRRHYFDASAPVASRKHSRRHGFRHYRRKWAL